MLTTMFIRAFAMLIFAVLTSKAANAQQLPIPETNPSNTTDCLCPENSFTSTAANQVYAFSNHKKIVACGYVLGEDKPNVLSEFVLAECGADTVLGFWDAMTECRLVFKEDTLFVEELYDLPMGTDFQLIPIVWTIESLSYKNDQLKREKRLNRNLKLYDDVSSKKVLQRYKQVDNVLNDQKMVLMDQLFVAALSNHKEAKSAFLGFHARFPTLDGAYLHQYRVFQEMLNDWEKGGETL